MDPQRLGRPRRVRRDQQARRDDRRGPRASSGPGAGLADRGHQDGTAARPGPLADVTDEQLEQRRTSRRGGGPGDDHLHLGHHGPPEGLRDHPRQPALRRPQRGPGRARRRSSRSPDSSTLLFLPLAHVVRPHHPGRLPGVRRDPRALAGHRARWPRLCPSSGPRSCSPCRGCSRRSTTARSSRPRRARPRAGSSTPRRRPRSPGARPPGGRRLGSHDAGHGPPAAPRAVRPARLRQAPGRGRRAGDVRGLRRRAARRAARPLLPRRGHHDPGGLRADRDLGGRHREQAEPEQDRHGRPAAARASPSRSPTTARSCSGARTSSPATGTTRRHQPRRWTRRAGCAPATSAAWTRRASCGSPGGRRSSSSPRAARTSRRPCSRTGSAPTR